MSQARNRITVTGISDRRSGASGASTSFILTVQKVFIDHPALASARDTVGATWHRIVERPRPSEQQHLHPWGSGVEADRRNRHGCV